MVTERLYVSVHPDVYCVCNACGMSACFVYSRYDPDLARFEDPPPVDKPDKETAIKFCSSCIRIRQKQLV